MPTHQCAAADVFPPAARDDFDLDTSESRLSWSSSRWRQRSTRCGVALKEALKRCSSRPVDLVTPSEPQILLGSTPGAARCMHADARKLLWTRAAANESLVQTEDVAEYEADDYSRKQGG